MNDKKAGIKTGSTPAYKSYNNVGVGFMPTHPDVIADTVSITTYRSYEEK